ncbi:MFS transporter [Arthrobacter sp. zg-Y1219]|uniref:MFS transporter n=1 Tax=Arthrobacter sp. zg-Y1219 TaxID=3049067 RepID=UPI0024C3E0D8|nr:MFS transporter [Arthrobacter sp. zg-Y1219]
MNQTRTAPSRAELWRGRRARGEDGTATTLLPRKAPTGLVVGILSLAGLVGAFMHSILIPIQAELPELLGASRAETAWVITITILVSCVCTPISGRLGDMFGKRRIILTLLSLLVAGSLLCAFSFSIVPMILGRALQGMGMGVIPIGIALLRDTVPAARLGSAIALVSATMGVGSAVGLPVAAFITSVGDWHLLFIVSTALGAVTLTLCALFLPQSQPGKGGRVDVVGAAGLAAWLTALLLFLSQGNVWGWTSPWALGCAGAAAFFLGAWTWHQWRRSDPLVDVRVSLQRPVLMTNIASAAMGFAMFVPSIAFPQILTLPAASGGLGLPLLAAGLILMPSGLAMLAMSPIAGGIIDRLGPQPLLVVGSVVLTAAYLIALLAPTTDWTVGLVMAVVGVGIGLGYAAMPTLIMQAVPVTETAAANGLNTLVRALGTATASAIVAGVLAHSASASGTGDPTSGGFRYALLLGATGAVMSVILALAVPRGRKSWRTHRRGDLP